MLAKKSSLRDYKSSFKWNDLVIGIKKKRQIPSMWNGTTDQELPCHLLHWGWQWTQQNTSETYLRREQFSSSMQFEINNFIHFFFYLLTVLNQERRQTSWDEDLLILAENNQPMLVSRPRAHHQMETQYFGDWKQTPRCRLILPCSRHQTMD